MKTNDDINESLINVLIVKLVKLVSMRLFKSSASVCFIAFSFLFVGCSSVSNQSRTQSLFNTKTEAEKAAKNFNCVGAHKMGDKWMPCEKLDDHEKHKGDGSHGHHHNH